MSKSQYSFRNLTAWLILSLAVGFVNAQTPNSFTEQNRLIRIKKIATEWQGSVLTLHTRDETKIRGRLMDVSAGAYHLKVNDYETIDIPLGDVVKVSFEPGTPEILLSFASAVMGSAFLSGALLIADEGASQGEVSVAALIGMLGGGLWGYSTFYETEVIELE